MNELKLIFGLICDDVRLEVGGKISIIGESNILFLPTIPMTVPLCVVTKWAGQPGTTANVTLQIISPDSATPVPISTQEVELGETDMDTSYGGTVNKVHWQFQTAGVYTIQILLNGQEHGRIEVVVHREHRFSN